MSHYDHPSLLAINQQHIITFSWKYEPQVTISVFTHGSSGYIVLFRPLKVSNWVKSHQKMHQTSPKWVKFCHSTVLSVNRATAQWRWTMPYTDWDVLMRGMSTFENKVARDNELQTNLKGLSIMCEIWVSMCVRMRWPSNECVSCTNYACDLRGLHSKVM